MSKYIPTNICRMNIFVQKYLNIPIFVTHWTCHLIMQHRNKCLNKLFPFIVCTFWMVTVAVFCIPQSLLLWNGHKVAPPPSLGHWWLYLKIAAIFSHFNIARIWTEQFWHIYLTHTFDPSIPPPASFYQLVSQSVCRQYYHLMPNGDRSLRISPGVEKI